MSTSTKSSNTKSGKSSKKSTEKVSKTDVPVVVDAPADDEKKERKHREVSKTSVDADFSVLSSRIEAEIERLRESSDKAKGVKFLRTVNKLVKALHADTKRVLKLKKPSNRSGPTNTGFFKPGPISEELAKFCGWAKEELHSRVEVTRFLCTYIKKHHLYAENDKKHIVPDTPLRSLLHYDQATMPPLTYFYIQKLLNVHLVKVPSAGSSTAKPAVATTSSTTTVSAPVAEVTAKAPKAKSGKKSSAKDASV